MLGIIDIGSGQPEQLADRVERFIKERMNIGSNCNTECFRIVRTTTEQFWLMIPRSEKYMRRKLLPIGSQAYRN